MIFADFLRALGQWGDPRFSRVLWLGVALALALLVGVYALSLVAIQTLTPDTIEIPLVGPVGGLDTLLSWGSAILMIVMSVVLMVPVASVFSGLFLEDVAAAVEERHYPALAVAPPVRWADALIASLNFTGLLIGVNLIGFVAYAVVGVVAAPLLPFVFWGVNGFLLGREYFTLVAMRRMGRMEAVALRRRHSATIWLAGALMAAPLSVPIVNLAIPVLGAATFTHLFHRLNRRVPH